MEPFGARCDLVAVCVFVFTDLASLLRVETQNSHSVVFARSGSNRSKQPTPRILAFVPCRRIENSPRYSLAETAKRPNSQTAQLPDHEFLAAAGTAKPPDVAVVVAEVTRHQGLGQLSNTIASGYRMNKLASRRVQGYRQPKLGYLSMPTQLRCLDTCKPRTAATPLLGLACSKL